MVLNNREVKHVRVARNPQCLICGGRVVNRLFPDAIRPGVPDPYCPACNVRWVAIIAEDTNGR